MPTAFRVTEVELVSGEPRDGVGAPDGVPEIDQE